MFQGEGRYYNPYKYDSNLISFYIPLLSLYLFTYRCSLGSYAFVSKSNVDNGYHISSDKNKSLERFCMCVCVSSQCFAECEFTGIKKIVFLLCVLYYTKNKSLFCYRSRTPLYFCS